MVLFIGAGIVWESVIILQIWFDVGNYVLTIDDSHNHTLLVLDFRSSKVGFQFQSRKRRTDRVNIEVVYNFYNL